MTHCVAFGDPFDGLVLVGPFGDHESALAYAETHRTDYESWTVVYMAAPEED